METIAAYSTSNRKIDPARRPHTRPDGSPDDNDRAEIGPTPIAFQAWARAGLEAPNLEAMRSYRLQRIVAELRKHDYAGMLCFDPLNIRYVTDSTNMQLWITHNPSRACFVSADGYVVLWDYANCEHLSAHLPLVREVRTGASFFYFVSGERVVEHANRFAGEVDALMRKCAGKNRRLAIDRIEPEGLMALHRLGIETRQGQVVSEHARAIKGSMTINRSSLRACSGASRARDSGSAPKASSSSTSQGRGTAARSRNPSPDSPSRAVKSSSERPSMASRCSSSSSF